MRAVHGPPPLVVGMCTHTLATVPLPVPVLAYRTSYTLVAPTCSVPWTAASKSRSMLQLVERCGAAAHKCLACETFCLLTTGQVASCLAFFLFQQLEACHSGSTPADDGVTVTCKVVAGSVLEVHAVSGSSDTVVQQLSEECARKLRCMYATRAPESKSTTAEFEVSAAASLLMHKAVDAARSFAPLPRAALEALEASAGAVLAGVVQATYTSHGAHAVRVTVHPNRRHCRVLFQPTHCIL